MKQLGPSHTGLNQSSLPWIPDDLLDSLSRVTSLLCNTFGTEVARIGLYGSWQRGNADTSSDVDVVVILNHEVPWFDERKGITCRVNSYRDRYRWYLIRKAANKYAQSSKVFSIAILTPAMLEYYLSQGPIHLQNWVHALIGCYVLWENEV